MMKSYGKEAYFQLEQLKNELNVDGQLPSAWQQHCKRVEVSPNKKINYFIFEAKQEDQIELNLDIKDGTKKIEKVDLIIDHVVVASGISNEGNITIKAIFTYLPASTMQLQFYGNFTTETIFLHSSIKANDVTLVANESKTFYSYTNNNLYTLTLCDGQYYLASCTLDDIPNAIAYGKTDCSITQCENFIVSDFYGEITACIMWIEEGDIILYDLISKKTISITGKEVKCAGVTISLSAVDPIQVIYHGSNGWIVQGISKEFELSQTFACSSLDTALQNMRFASITGISSTQYTIGSNGYIGISTKGKVIYFRPIWAMLKNDTFRATILNIGKVQSIWGVELDDGIHLIAKDGMRIKEYLLTYEDEKVKLTTLITLSNAQDLIYSKADKYAVYLDQHFKVEENA